MLKSYNLKRFSKIDTILWDWNGTILDDVDICVTSMNNMLTKRNIPTVTAEFYYQNFTFPIKNYYEKIGWDFTKEDFSKVSEEFMTNYDELFNSAPLHHNIKDTFSFLKAQGYRQIVLSALENSLLKESLKTHKLNHFFDAAYGIENILGGGKIHLANRLMKEQQLNPANTCMIGDTEHDFEVAETIGAQCILIAHGHHKFERLSILNTTVVHNLTELMDVFHKICTFKAE
jgi:phosphoglycolate phosphatase